MILMEKIKQVAITQWTQYLRGKTLQKGNIHGAMIINILIDQGRITTTKH
jgi:hypothetical protein